MEVRVSFTVAKYGRDPDNGERFMEAFMEAFPEGGPSISQNFEDGTLTVTFAFDAEDARHAVEQAIAIFNTGANNTGLPPTDVLDVEASVVPAEQPEDTPALEPVPA
jgi:hypothetical protein